MQAPGFQGLPLSHTHPPPVGEPDGFAQPCRPRNSLGPVESSPSPPRGGEEVQGHTQGLPGPLPLSSQEPPGVVVQAGPPGSHHDMGQASPVSHSDNRCVRHWVEVPVVTGSPGPRFLDPVRLYLAHKHKRLGYSMVGPRLGERPSGGRHHSADGQHFSSPLPEQS